MGCLGPDCAGVYKASLLKAFRRTVEEGRSAFVIVDAPNLRVEDFKPYWDAGQVWTAPASSFSQLPRYLVKCFETTIWDLRLQKCCGSAAVCDRPVRGQKLQKIAVHCVFAHFVLSV